MKRPLAAILTILLLASALPACASDTPDVSTGDSAETTASTTTVETTTEDPLDDKLPEKNFDGHVFTFYTHGDTASTFAPESEVGEVVNDAIYRRNRTVEERFNIDIAAVTSEQASGSKHRAAIEALILAGGDEADIVVNTGKYITGQSLSGSFVNLHTLDYLNFEKPWWSQKLVDDLTYMGRMFAFSNNIAYEEFAASKVFYFNKEKIEDYKLEDPYQLVFEGKFTLDKFISMTRDVYEDVNGDGTADASDFYGLLTTTSHNTWQLALDIPVWEKNANSLTLVANSEKANNAYDKLYDFYYNSKGLYLWHSYSAADKPMREMFINGQGLFTFGFVGDSGIHYRETEVDYGIVPFPKYDEDQEDYRVFFGANSSNMFGIPITASNLERTAIIIEAMSAEGYKTLIPAYYEVALKAKYLRDENSVKMLDLITANRTISFAYCHDEFSKFSVDFGMALAKGSDRHSASYATFYASREELVKQRLTDITEAFAKTPK